MCEIKFVVATRCSKLEIDRFSMGNKTNFDLGFALQPPRLTNSIQDQHYR
jgi:hypothetical protein